MKKTKLFIVVGGILLTTSLSAVLFLTGDVCVESDVCEERKTTKPVAGSETEDHIVGSGDSGVQLVEARSKKYALQSFEMLDEAELKRVRSLIDEIVMLDEEELLDKSELEAIVSQMPGEGGVSGMARILSGLIMSENVEDRIEAFTLLTVLRREWDAEVIDADGDDDGVGNAHDHVSDLADSRCPEGNEAETMSQDYYVDAELESSVVMAMMSKGLADSDESVREAAFDTLASLPSDERSALSLQVLGNDDDVLKVALLERQTDSSDETAVTLNFHGLDSDDENVRNLAAENIKQMFGVVFDSAASAFDWWETERGNACSK